MFEKYDAALPYKGRVTLNESNGERNRSSACSMTLILLEWIIGAPDDYLMICNSRGGGIIGDLAY